MRRMRRGRRLRLAQERVNLQAISCNKLSPHSLQAAVNVGSPGVSDKPIHFGRPDSKDRTARRRQRRRLRASVGWSRLIPRFLHKIALLAGTFRPEVASKN